MPDCSTTSSVLVSCSSTAIFEMTLKALDRRCVSPCYWGINLPSRQLSDFVYNKDKCVSGQTCFMPGRGRFPGLDGSVLGLEAPLFTGHTADGDMKRHGVKEPGF